MSVFLMHCMYTHGIMQMQLFILQLIWWRVIEIVHQFLACFLLRRQADGHKTMGSVGRVWGEI